MIYVTLFLVLFGLYVYLFKDVARFKNYYLGKYFNKVLGLLLILFNMIPLLLNVFFDIVYFDILIPIFLAIFLYKHKEKDFNYFLVKDTYYPNKLDDKPIRNTVRGICINSKNEVALIHIDFDDPLFGYRDHFELPGGGIEESENRIEALKREMEEEIGYTIKDIHYLTKCGIEYNPFNRIDNAEVFVCYVDKKTQTNFQGIEKEFIKGIEFVNINKLIKIYDSDNQDRVGKMIYERDSKLIKLYKSCS